MTRAEWGQALLEDVKENFRRQARLQAEEKEPAVPAETASSPHPAPEALAPSPAHSSSRPWEQEGRTFEEWLEERAIKAVENLNRNALRDQHRE
jgi:hypothetical protein